MCAIFGSSDPQMLVELYDANMHRGGHSYSIMTFDNNMGILNIIKSTDQFPTNASSIRVKGAAYYLAHVQAPTDGVGSSSPIHPAHIGQHYLYHNGQIKPRSIEPGTWDTEWLLNKLLINDPIDYKDSLNDVDGSFACAFIDSVKETVILFTNPTCALYYKGTDISSTKINSDWTRIIPCKVYSLSLKGVVGENEFNNEDNTYFIP